MRAPAINLRSAATSLSPSALAIGAAIAALALAGGGSSDLAIGVAAALVWALVGAAALGGLLDPIAPRPSLVWAGAFLAALVAMTAVSLAWATDDGAGFVDVVRVAGYLGAFVLAGLAIRRGEGRQVLAAIAIVLVAIGLLALASRLLGVGAGDAELAERIPSAAGRLSYPIGYWNGLGALMAMAMPLLAWLAGSSGPRSRALALAAIPVPLLVAYMTSSRGALLAAALGVVVVAGFASERRRTVAAVALGALAVAPAVAVATLQSGILDTPGDGIGRAELVVATALLAGCGLLLALGDRAVTAIGSALPRGMRVRPAFVVPALLAIVAGLILLAGPSALVGDFRATDAGQTDARTSGIISSSGSGRAQFWSTAIDGFASAPLKGIGAGGYGTYWNQHGSLVNPVENAHSEPLELLAELGLAGLAAFAGFFAVAIRSGVHRVRGPDGAAAGAALGLLLAGLLGISIDWTWSIPAVALPIVVAAALLTGAAFAPARATAREVRRIPAPLATVGLLAAGLAVVWAGAVLAIASSRLEASEAALARGQLGEAASEARAAAAVEPWAGRPWLELAGIEAAADNFGASRRAARAAIDRSPDDFQAWLLVASAESGLGNRKAVAAYAERALLLAPLIAGRSVAIQIGGGSFGR